MARAQLLDIPEESEETQVAQEPEQLQEIPQEELQEDAQPTNEDDDIPEKYRGKTAKELVEMHQNAEQALGKQSSEVGELRKVVDNFITSQLSNQQAPVEDDEEVDFFVDPDRAVAKAIEKNPTVQQLNQASVAYQRETALATLKNKHPDMEQILKDAAFMTWVKGSKIRTDLFKQADEQMDANAADELFSYWKERQGVVQQTAAVEQQARKQQIKAASTGNAGGAGDTKRKKIYRRSDIIKLMRDDPDRYAALSDEIMEAYLEKRVR